MSGQDHGANLAKVRPGTTTVADSSSNKPCVHQGLNFLVCVLLGAAVTYLSLYSDVINVTPNFTPDVTPKFSYIDIGRTNTDVMATRETPSGTSIDRSTGVVEPSDSEKCKEQTRFAFVKVHKAGGTTPQAVFQRFGYRRHLHFVLPSRSSDVNVGWPHLMKPEDYLPPIPGQPFDLLVFHTVYNRQIFRSLMPNNTLYLAIVREPYSHLKSVMNWFAVARKYGLTKRKPVTSLMKNPAELDRQWLTSKQGYKQPFSWTRNFMSYDLGLPVALASDDNFIRDYVAQLDRDFLLVLVLEYFDESLVLMKRYMCWQLSDIFYKVRNVRAYTFKESDELPEKVRETHKNWSKADYLLYQHFNNTLWEKIANESDDFYSEVKWFKHLNRVTSQFCERAVERNDSSVKVFQPTAWNDRIVVNRTFCGLLNMTPYQYRQALIYIHNKHLKSASKVTTKRRHPVRSTANNG